MLIYAQPLEVIIFQLKCLWVKHKVHQLVKYFLKKKGIYSVHNVLCHYRFQVYFIYVINNDRSVSSLGPNFGANYGPIILT